MLSSSVLGAIALCASGVVGHGAVTSYIIGGTTYPGYDAYGGGQKSVIQRPYRSYDPVTSAADAKMRCNGGTNAPLNATIAPGEKIAAVWGQWTHSQGPIMVWMYKCAGAFASCDGSGAGWFKIDEAGFHGDGTAVFLDTERPSGWDIAKLVGGNKQWSSTIPAGLAAGNYLIRHELIALHQANAPQFYPECAQIVVSGSGTAVPDASYKASIPGYCKQTDANVRVPINDHKMEQKYVIPGPPVYKGAGAKKARDFIA